MMIDPEIPFYLIIPDFGYANKIVFKTFYSEHPNALKLIAEMEDSKRTSNDGISIVESPSLENSDLEESETSEIEEREMGEGEEEQEKEEEWERVWRVGGKRRKTRNGGVYFVGSNNRPKIEISDDDE